MAATLSTSINTNSFQPFHTLSVWWAQRKELNTYLLAWILALSQGCWHNNPFLLIWVKRGFIERTQENPMDWFPICSWFVNTRLLPPLCPTDNRWWYIRFCLVRILRFYRTLNLIAPKLAWSIFQFSHVNFLEGESSSSDLVRILSLMQSGLVRAKTCHLGLPRHEAVGERKLLQWRVRSHLPHSHHDWMKFFLHSVIKENHELKQTMKKYHAYIL